MTEEQPVEFKTMKVDFTKTNTRYISVPFPGWVIEVMERAAKEANSSKERLARDGAIAYAESVLVAAKIKLVDSQEADLKKMDEEIGNKP